MKKLHLILGWWLVTMGAIMAAAITVNSMLTSSISPIAISFPGAKLASSADAYPPIGEVKGISTIVEGEDARPDIVANFLKRHDAPLKPHDEYGRILVKIADKYGVDFRLLPAIAMQESNLCKKIPPGSYNCLGFGIHERGTLMFESYEANFDRAARELKANYIDGGRGTPEEIMRKYTPSSNGSWAASVNQWIAEMRYDDREKGRELKVNADLHEFTAQVAPSILAP
jgi:hypothetical protein